MRRQYSLFIAGTSENCEVALNNLKEIFDSTPDNNYDLQIVDVLKNPELAEKEKIVASPTLILNNSEPSRRLIGNFSKKESVLKWLNFPEVKSNVK